MAGSIMQRKSKAAIHSNNAVITQRSSSDNNKMKMASVRRRTFGTSPFDKHWLNMDCCGLICACLTYCLHLYGCYSVCFILIPPWMSYHDSEGMRHLTMMGQLNCFAFVGVAGMAVFSHLKAMTTDPGAVPPDAKPILSAEELAALEQSEKTSSLKPEEVNKRPSSPTSGMQEGGITMASVAAAGAGAAVAAVAASLPTKPVAPGPVGKGRRLCRRCNSFKPQRAHHCSICKRCIVKMDHHCPWVNNCVGIGNHKFFLLFIFYTCVSCCYSMSLLVMRFYLCVGMHTHHRHQRHHGAISITTDSGVTLGNKEEGHCLDDPAQLLNLIGLVVEAMLFGLFTLCMMCDQWSVVTSRLTHIDRLKGESSSSMNDRYQKSSALNEVFGIGRKLGRNRQDSFRADWLSPFVSACFPSSMRDEVMGFCRPCGARSSQNSDVEMPNRNRMVRSVDEIV